MLGFLFLTFPLAAWAPPGDDDLEALKAKNIKQTELVADLREAILQVARHFQCVDPKNCSIVSGMGAATCRTGAVSSRR